MTRTDLIESLTLPVAPGEAPVAPLSAAPPPALTAKLFAPLTLAEALREARRTGRYVMIALHANECPYSRRMERETYPDANIIALARPFVCIQTAHGTVEGREIEREYGVDTWPTLLFLDGAGDVLRQVEGFQSPRALAEVLGELACTEMGARRSFWFYDSLEPVAARYWRQINAHTWCETYPEGPAALFRLQDAASVDGVPGIVVRRLADDGMDVFIPNDLSIGARILYRTPVEAAWRYLAQVRGR